MIKFTKRILNRSGFTMVEALAGVAVTTILITGSMFLAGESSKSVAHTIQEMSSYLVLQNFAESMMVQTGATSDLGAGNQGPVYFTTDGQLATTGPVTVTWINTYNSPMAQVMQVDISAQFLVGGASQTKTLTIYRSMPLQSPPSVTPMPVAIATPPPVPTIWWDFGPLGACGAVTPNQAFGTVTCVDHTIGSAVSSSLCSQPAPSNSSVCTQYYWATSSWMTCAGSSQARSVYCYDSVGLVTVAGSFCVSAPPPASQPCLMTCIPDCS